MYTYERVKDMQFIENTQDLENLCNKLSNEEFVCVDLEFLRQHTYFAKLCLIQIASVNDEAIIDPLAENINLQPFFDLMQNEKIVKVFHSGRQDIEIIYNLSAKIPTPLFDTQIAAMVDGYGEAISYEHLVNTILHISIDKSSRLSDWSNRPLNENQLNYAISDVTHLVKIYQHLKSKLYKENRLEWIKDELSALCDESLYKINPHNMWQKIRHRSHSAKFLTYLRELCAWRENRAINKNVPRQSFIKDDLLLNICSDCPTSKEDLCKVRGMRNDLAMGKIGDEILDVIKKVKVMSEGDYVSVPDVKDFSRADGSLTELLKMLLKITAQQHKTVSRLIASEDDLKSFCQDDNNEADFMKGWRYEIFGIHAKELKSGNLSISYNPKTHLIDFKKL